MTTVLAVPVAVSVLETGLTFTSLARTLPVNRSVKVTVEANTPPAPVGSATLAVSVTWAVVLLLPDVQKTVWPMYATTPSRGVTVSKPLTRATL